MRLMALGVLLVTCALPLAACAEDAESDAQVVLDLNQATVEPFELEMPDGSTLSYEVRGSLTDEDPSFGALCDFPVNVDAVQFERRPNGDAHMLLVLEPIQPDVCG